MRLLYSIFPLIIHPKLWNEKNINSINLLINYQHENIQFSLHLLFSQDLQIY
jgi:hypothetical protein